MSSRKRLRLAMGLLAGGLLLAGCGSRGVNTVALPEVPGGDPERGRQAIRVYGCEACHTIPGVPGANANVGPPLTAFAHRQYIAGQLANTPDNLVLWIMYPQQVEPGTAMPDLGVPESDARDIAAYLATLR